MNAEIFLLAAAVIRKEGLRWFFTPELSDGSSAASNHSCSWCTARWAFIIPFTKTDVEKALCFMEGSLQTYLESRSSAKIGHGLKLPLFWKLYWTVYSFKTQNGKLFQAAASWVSVHIKEKAVSQIPQSILECRLLAFPNT